MAKKLLAFLLTFALLLSTIASVAIVPASAADVEAWDGSVATAFAGGSGTKDDPYQISNGAELAYLFNGVQTVGTDFAYGKYYKLTANIYLNDVTKADWKENNPNSWYTAKSDNNYRFRGNFDGAGYTVYGMYYSGESGYIGLLPVMDSWYFDLTVKNLTISDSYVSTSGSIIGAVSSRLYSDNKKTAHFYNIKITESVVIESTTANAYVGGILGFSNCNANSFYQFSGCAVLADISSGHALIGYGDSKTLAKIVQSYTTAADWYPTNAKTSNNTYIIEDDATIKGADAAKAAMPNLDWLRIWGCSANGYPYPMDYNTNNVTGLPWTGLWAANFAGGTGTAEDPYIIETPEQLAKMVKFGNTKGEYFKITKDIYLNNVSDPDWKTNSPKAWFDYEDVYKTAFVGNVDGAGHTIYGMYYNGSNTFAFLPYAQNTSIKNLRISESDITASARLAGFVAVGATKLSFSYCMLDDTVYINGGSADTAGYVAHGSPSVYIDSSVALSHITGGQNVGSFIGDCWWVDGVKHVINNSYGADYPLDAKLGYEASNCYNTVAETRTFTEGEVVNLGSRDLMQGADALKNMPLLHYFGTTDTYPVIYQQGTIGKVWSGSVAANYAKGTGTKADPYVIATAEQLVKLVKDANTKDKYYLISADIKLNDTSAENWTENAKQWFGYSSASEFPGVFAGTLEGAGSTISGLYYNGDKYYVGLFVSCNGATFNNITISESSLVSSHTSGSVSAFTGYVGGSITYNGCAIDETVILSGAHVSGFASYGSGNITINSCSSTANISGTKYTAAFIADVWSSTLKISNSYGLAAFSPRRSFTGSNNYGTVEDGYGTNVVTAEQMQGATALENMSLLTGYFATEGYPVRYLDSVVGSVWSGAVAPTFASGDGSRANPYEIKTGEQLARMLYIDSEDIYFKLGADIVLSDESKENNWYDSANSEPFEGDFNGNGYIISGLKYNKEATGMLYAGLIPEAKNAYISNVILEDSTIAMTTNSEQATYVGGIVGYITGATNIYSCYVADSVKLSNVLAETSAAKKNSIGGILGGGNIGFTIDGCAFFGEMEGFDYRYGAVFGDVWGGSESTRIVKYTMAANYVPSSRWGFNGSHNVATVAMADGIDVNESFTIAETLKGEEGFKAAQNANWNGRYFGTENYPVLSTLGKRFEDVNGDRICDAVDLTIMRRNLTGSSVLGYIDINGDGKADVKDLVSLKKKFVSDPVKEGYELVWFDEFNGTELDATKWNTSQTRMSDTNELAQSNLSSVRKVSAGNLQLTAMENEWYNAESDKYFEQHKYMTTGSVTTEGRMSYQYGYLEIRAKVPYKEGCWPSFWLRSHNSTGKQENPDFEVEVDVFEVFGSTNAMASNLHQQNFDDESYQTTTTYYSELFNIIKYNNDTEKYTFSDSDNLSNEYHIYAFEWEPDRMAIYVDGVLNCEWSLNKSALKRYGLKGNVSGFDTTMNILFNNHLFTSSSKLSSGTIIEDYEENLPAEFDIDYVRLYQKNDGLSKLILG